MIAFTLRSQRFGSGPGGASIIRFRIIQSAARSCITSGRSSRGLKHSEQRHESISWWTRLDSNQEPADYEPDALTVELRVRRLLHLDFILLLQHVAQLSQTALTSRPIWLDVIRKSCGDVCVAQGSTGLSCRRHRLRSSECQDRVEMRASRANCR